jgi:tetratricopeptide (TPR) repeat protein
MFASILFAPGLFAAAPVPGPASPGQAATVIGPDNPLLADGAELLEAGHYALGVRVTLQGLDLPSSPRDQAAGHSNVCAGLAALERWAEALEHCNEALALDRGNWRTFNNRAAVFVGLGQYELAMADVNAGLELAPDSATLLKSREVVIQHHDAAAHERWRKPDKA